MSTDPDPGVVVGTVLVVVGRTVDVVCVVGHALVVVTGVRLVVVVVLIRMKGR